MTFAIQFLCPIIIALSLWISMSFVKLDDIIFIIFSGVPLIAFIILNNFIKSHKTNRVLKVSSFLCISILLGYIFSKYAFIIIELYTYFKGNFITKAYETLTYLLERLPKLSPILPVLAFLFFFSSSNQFLVELSALIREKTVKTKRVRADSDLYGDSRLLTTAEIKKMSQHRGIIFGKLTPKNDSLLISYPLEGVALTIAPPRTGKGAIISANLLGPPEKIWSGSRIIVDPRGEQYCVAARHLRLTGRKPILIDPFGIVQKHQRDFPELQLTNMETASYNPFDFIRPDKISIDVDVLLEGFLTRPLNYEGNAKHFYDSAHALIGGYITWVYCTAPEHKKNMMHVYELLMYSEKDRDALHIKMKANSDVDKKVQYAIVRMEMVSDKEGGSNFTSIANQLKFLDHKEFAQSFSHSTFDFSELTKGNLDIFIICPFSMMEDNRGWLRTWITMANALPERTAYEKNLLIIFDEPGLVGYLKPVMDALIAGAGHGIHFWLFMQAQTSLEQSWGKDNVASLMDLIEVLQVLDIPGKNTKFADFISEACGEVTYENQNESVSQTTDPKKTFAKQQSQQEGNTTSLVKERLVTKDMLLNMKHEEQYVLTSSKDNPRYPMHIFQAQYWLHDEYIGKFDPNPMILRKQKAKTND